MNSKLTEETPCTTPTPVYIVPTRDSYESIRPADLWDVFLRRRWIPVASILISVALFFLYIVFAEPVYRAESHLLPPSKQAIQGLLVDIQEIKLDEVETYSPDLVFAEFLKNLKSQGLRRKYFDKNNLVSYYVKDLSDTEVNVDRVFDTAFNRGLQVRVDKQDPSFVTVSFENSSPELAAKWLKQYVEFTNIQTVNQLFGSVNAVIQAEQEKVSYQLESELKLAEQRRFDTITTLREALKIARELGIEDSSSFPRIFDETQTGLAVNTAQVPLYTRGVKALQTEVNVLEARKSDEPFINGFRDLQERRAYLDGISIDLDTLSAVSIDVQAKVPYRPQSPSVAGLLVLAVVLGGIVGIMAIFIVEYSRVSR